MKQSEWINLLEAPQSANFSDVAKLEVLKNEFPFFQSAHLLLSLTAKKHDSSLYQKTLKNTAISIPNRSRLFYLLNYFDKISEQVKQPIVEVKKVEVKVEKPTSEIQHLQTIERISEKREAKLTEEELNEQINKEVEKQVVSALVEKELLDSVRVKKTTTEEKKETLKSGSFSDWLHQYQKPQEASETKEEVEEVKKQPIKINPEKKIEQKTLIDKIIESNPGNIRLNPTQKFFAADNKAKESLIENEDLVTETLAKIYALQGNVSKAVRAYEILSLKFPQKSAYFASLIENLKK